MKKLALLNSYVLDDVKDSIAKNPAISFCKMFFSQNRKRIILAYQLRDINVYFVYEAKEICFNALFAISLEQVHNIKTSESDNDILFLDETTGKLQINDEIEVRLMNWRETNRNPLFFKINKSKSSFLEKVRAYDMKKRVARAVDEFEGTMRDKKRLQALLDIVETIVDDEYIFLRQDNKKDLLVLSGRIFYISLDIRNLKFLETNG